MKYATSNLGGLRAQVLCLSVSSLYLWSSVCPLQTSKASVCMSNMTQENNHLRNFEMQKILVKFSGKKCSLTKNPLFNFTKARVTIEAGFSGHFFISPY